MYRRVYLFLKRFVDVLFSLIIMIMFFPLFLMIAFSIKLFSPEGSVIFTHTRLGKDKKPFQIYKFRTMHQNAQSLLDEWLATRPEIKASYEKDFKLKDDPRIIPIVGNFLRKSSLDELPQFINVLIGNMSVVGPRPIVEEEVEKYGIHADKLFSVKPGITGLWQVSGRNDLTYDERVSLDMEYISNQNFWNDLRIIFQTIWVVLTKKGAY